MRIKLCLTLVLVFSAFTMTNAQAKDDSEGIRLIVRGDDMGSFHAANLACIQSYKQGIMRTVEIMVPCPWYPEAVKMLNENPGLDVGLHLVLTSEWENIKWRPLTGISSITDERGYFFPMVWPNNNFPPGRSISEAAWVLEDIEVELRAQIDQAKSDLKSLSHISCHMGFGSADHSIDSLVKALAIEYDLNIMLSDYQIKAFPYKKPSQGSSEDRVEAFIIALNKLEKGDYLFVEHPGLDCPEMSTVGHKGYMNVGKDRQMVTEMFTNKEIQKEIDKLGIELISYSILPEPNKKIH